MTDVFAGFIAYFVAVARDCAFLTFEMNQFAFHAFGFLGFQEIAVDEILGIQFGNLSESGFQRRSRLVNIVTV